MTPEDQERFDACIQEMAEILHRDSDPTALDTLEGIETTVRQHMLEKVSPKVALFLSPKSPSPPEADTVESRA